MKPELFTDEDINDLVDKIYGECIDKNCASCAYHSEVDTGVCKADIIMELWRKWKNVIDYIPVDKEIK